MYLHIFKKILINTILFPQPIVYDRMRVQLQAVVAAADLLQEIHAAFVRSRGMLLKNYNHPLFLITFGPRHTDLTLSKHANN
jgi:hypothetical protein